MKAWIAKNWFMLGMPLAVGLAWLIPDVGAKGGLLHTEITSKFGVAFVFFSQGLTLPARALKDGASQWKLHVAVQAFGFLVFPLAGIAFDAAVGGSIAPDLRWGFLFLTVLPSTIVMAVALATVAGGNVPAAIFNAVLSNVLGVFLTPIWAAALLHASEQSQSLGGVLSEVSTQLLLPLIAGQILRRVGPMESWADKRRKRLNSIANIIILVIVFAAFCNSVKSDLWAKHGWGTVAVAASGVAFLLAFGLIGTALLGKALGFAPAERIVLIFSGGQKSLATGVPLAKVIFGTHPGLGLILLPIMIYHPLQLFVCGTIGGRHARRHVVTSR